MRTRSLSIGLSLFVLLAVAGSCGESDPSTSTTSGSASGASTTGGEGGSGQGGGGGASAGAWQGLAPLANGPRQETAVVAFEGKILVIGGFDAAGEVVPDVEAYDPETNTWAPFTPLPKSLHHVNAAVVGGKVYVLGALRDPTFIEVGDVYEYDPAGKAWIAKTKMTPGTERGAAAVGVIGTKIYIAGGFRMSAVADFSAYDTATDTWEELPDLPAPRDHLVGGAAGGVMYAIGGRNGSIGSVDDAVYAFDPSAGMWTERAEMPTARGGSAAALVGGRFIVAGGEGNQAAASGVFDDVEAYDPAKDAWTILTPMFTPRHGTGGAELNGKLYVPGGADKQAFGAVDTVEVYVP
jgi:N-acetylneuraminic acid mutarotase